MSLAQDQSKRPQPVHPHPLEFDENGVPYYKWPPFPSPPPGVEITPFKDFKPKGIQIRLPVLDDEEDGTELDGEGIPTVMLNVKHASADQEVDGDDVGKKSRKKKKIKKANGEEVTVKTTWWEDWETGEDLRSNYHYDQKLPREDRFVHASEDFKRSRSWPPTITEIGQIYDQFRMYVGLIGSSSNPFVGKSKAKQFDFGIDDEDEEDSEGDVDMSNGQEVPPVQLAGVKADEWDALKHQPADSKLPEIEDNRTSRKLVAKEARMEAFLNDPYTSVKIYLTSYARDRGFYWSEMKLRDAPLLVEFFIKFINRNGALPECGRALARTIALLKLAKAELPQTKTIALTIPDELSLSCASLFGSQLLKMEWPDARPRESVEGEDGDEDRMNKKVKLEERPEIAEPKPEPVSWTEYTVPETADKPGARIFEINDDGERPVEIAESAPKWADDTTWWSKSVDAGEGGVGDWGAVDAENAGWNVPTHSLMTLLGPTTLPLTHTVGYVEESVRQIVSWSMPSEGPGAVMSDPFKCFAVVEMRPYKESTLSAPEKTSIREPKLLKDPLSSAGSTKDVGESETDVEVPPHDAKNDHITVLMLPATAKTLMQGIGINATWIQVAPKKAASDGKRSGKGESKGKGKGKEELQAWWYMEQVVQVLPSFWEELPANNRNATNGREG